MAKEIYPIIELGRANGLPLEIDDILESMDLKYDDEFTYTTRYTVPEERRDEVAEEIRKKLDAEDAERFLSFMQRHGWDVSFLVDMW